MPEAGETKAYISMRKTKSKTKILMASFVEHRKRPRTKCRRKFVARQGNLRKNNKNICHNELEALYRVGVFGK